MKDRPIVKEEVQEINIFISLRRPASILRFYSCYALPAKDIIAAMIFVIDRCFTTKVIKESKGKINILVVILLFERILKKIKNRYI